MIDLTQIERLKYKLGIEVDDFSQDNLLSIYLQDAADFITSITNTDEVPVKLLSTQEDLAVMAYNKQGIEGQTSHSEGGISRTFGDIPESMMKKIRSFRRLPR